MSFYCQFIKPNGLVFDIGAYRGSKTAQMLDCNPRMVVAFEPQKELAKKIQAMFLRDERVRVENCAIGVEEGTATMYLSYQADTIATIEEKWTKGRFASYGWEMRLPVKVHTLDFMFDLYGDPCFIKIDAEGSDYKIIKTLTMPVPAICFEFVAEYGTDAFAAISHMNLLGKYEFNVSKGDYEHLDPYWYSAEEFLDLEFYTVVRDGSWGMIYARLVK